MIAGRMRRRGAISEDEYRVALGLPREAPAPEVDSTLFAPQDFPAAGHDATPEGTPAEDSAGAPEAEPAYADTSIAPR